METLPFAVRHWGVGFLARHAPRLLSLERLGAYHGTDKVAHARIDPGLSYGRIYEHYLAGWRNDRFSLLEIGVYRGSSLRMWRAYFRRARIAGLDISAEAAARAQGFEVFVGSQADPELLERALAALPDLRLVIDDGSHVNELTIASFEFLFPRLPSGAIYVIEDTLCTYEPALAEWPGMELNEGVAFDNRREDFDAFLAGLHADCDTGGDERTVAFVHAWPGQVVVGRA